jgi:hypothetical protein
VRLDRRGADELKRAGFTVLREFASALELEQLRAGVETKLRQAMAPGCERPHNTLAPLRWSDELVVRALGCQRRIAAIRAASDARDLRWVSAYVSVKDARSPPLWWHQDWWCWEHPVTYRMRPPQVAVLCYLRDTSPETGALRVLPGTHRRSVDLHAVLPEAHGDEAGILADGHPALRDHPQQQTVSVRAGDAVVIDYRLLHGTHANVSAIRRECLLLTFAPDWSVLPDDVRAHLIRHPALPGPREIPVAVLAGLLPDYDGTPRDLSLSRRAPATFTTDATVAL